MKVEIIPKNSIPDHLKPKRVAAYCRVSTKKEIQQNSLEAQMSFFNETIRQRINWIFVGIYADSTSGRNNLKMKEFQRMMDDCRAGKIDLILVKSVSRLGRNTVQFLQACSELNELGVDVYFLLEHIHINDPEAARIMSIFASVYQNENEDKSESVKWGFKAGFISGASGFANRKCYGYTHDQNGEFIPYPPEADIVKMIYDMRCKGVSLRKIAKELMDKRISSPRGNPTWGIETIRVILNNEKYRGDVLLQKTYVSDYFTGRQSKNNGVLEQYLIEDHHETIIPKRK